MSGDIGSPRKTQKIELTTQWRAADKPYDRDGVLMMDCYRDQFRVTQTLGDDGEYVVTDTEKFDFPKLCYPLHVAYTKDEYTDLRSGKKPNDHKLSLEVIDTCLANFEKARQGTEAQTNGTQSASNIVEMPQRSAPTPRAA